MDLIQFSFLTLIGGYIAIKLKIPGGGIIGPMILVGLFQSTEWIVIENIPKIIRWTAQSMLGVFIGLQFSKKVLKLSRRDFLSFTIVSLTSILSSFLFGFVLFLFTKESFLTSVVSAVPGSMAEMLMLADSMNLNTQSVAVLHLLRFILLLTLIPVIITVIEKRRQRTSKNKEVV